MAEAPTTQQQHQQQQMVEGAETTQKQQQHENSLEERQSTVLFFNYNNLFILLAIKLVVILALTGSFGFLGKRRSVEDDGWVNENDLLFMTTFLLNDDLQRHQCLSLLACLKPRPAHDLHTAASLISRGADYLPKFEWRWLEEVREVRRALEKGITPHQQGTQHQHGPLHCRTLYPCPALPFL
ncbi:hypothetical protein Pmani_019041 [Petrolisthes manimaculis]|uniref:Uncharacterized protein n=1 Tax=Petrolisthes manimaculis TaxID=1843537 RepID=A0AAE1PJ55_9EUCA|nr:hypothetical protein Pmani_019041 [Petrolisthes manimaculis]